MGGVPGEIVSEDGDFIVRGDGTGEWPGRKAMPMMSRYRSTNQGITTNTLTTVNFDSAAPDDRSDAAYFTYSAGVVTIKKAGVYRLKGVQRWASNATSYREMDLAINGSIKGSDAIAPSANNVTQSIERTRTLAVNDTVEFQARHNIGSNLNILGDAGTTMQTILEIEWRGTV